MSPILIWLLPQVIDRVLPNGPSNTHVLCMRVQGLERTNLHNLLHLLGIKDLTPDTSGLPFKPISVSDITLSIILPFLILKSKSANVNVLWINDKKSVMMNGNDIGNSTDKVCNKLKTMLDEGRSPDMILDTTSAGTLSEVVKSLSLSLGIPTLSTSYGDLRDVREWRNLTSDQGKYLIRVRPPGDLLPNIIRNIITSDNITNAAVLYDDSFVMDYKYRSLLQNIPVRHMIQKIRTGKNELKGQLMRMSQVDLNNYFVFGSVKTIEEVVAKANEMKLYGTKYAWFAITKVHSNNIIYSVNK
ncbi:GRIN [Lepeophtheirus salmonis]|uniref:GRIN n=1 Tax=Lepeophtheirus salmonis TaxID=72036 RepID=A0A7R8CWW8_LEPSM|nr:GRIN [Lepeophtheirus salmonis]CAF2956606.1 GRIN [Lepeophtheirus salmonis]